MTASTRKGRGHAAPLLAVVVAGCLPVTAVAVLGVAVVPGSVAPSAATGVGPVGRVPDPVPGRYVVVLADGVESRTAAAGAKLVGPTGGTIVATFAVALPGFVAEMSERRAARIAADPLVAGVFEDGYVRIAGTQSPAPWALDRVDQASLPLDGAYRSTFAGRGVTAYVVDTGILTTHTEFGGRASLGLDLVGDGRAAGDCHGHGTAVASLIAGSGTGIAKAAAVVGVRAMGCDGTGTFSQVLAAVDWITANAARPAVVNLSLAGPAYEPLDTAITNSIASGLTYVVAAGNDQGDACARSPARTSSALTVGATDVNDARAYFSNAGTCLDLFAPGVGMTVAVPPTDSEYSTASGTSFAAPVVAGLVALVLERHPGLGPSDVRALLVRAAPTDRVVDPGTGSPNRLARSFEALSPHPGVVIAVVGDHLTESLMEGTLGGDPAAPNYNPLVFIVRGA